MQQQGAEAQAIAELINFLRNQIFTFNQVARDILALEDTHPRAAAGGIALLTRRYEEMGLVPQMFPELQDKEYVAETAKLLRESDRRLRAALPPADQGELEMMVERVQELPAANQFLAWQPLVAAYQAALPDYRRLKTWNGDRFVLMLLAALAALFMLPFFCGAFGFVLGDFGGILGLLAGLGMGGGAIGLLLYQYSRHTDKEGYQRAKAAVDAYRKQVNVKQYEALARKFDNDYQEAARHKQDAERLLISFFAGTGLLDMMEMDLPDIPAGLESPQKVNGQRSPADTTISTATFCSHCQQPISDTAAYCASCGKPVHDIK